MKILLFWFAAVCAVMAQAPSITSVSPNSGTGLTQTYTVTVTDASSGNNIVELDFMVNPPSGTFGVNACHAVYYPQWNQVTIHNDSDTSPYVLAYLMPGQPGTVTNSQCTLNGQGVTKQINGAQFTATFPLTFNANWSGTQQINALAQNAANYSSGWTNKGSWTIPGPSGAPVINSVTPNAGSGISQTFAITITDPTNGNNIVEADVMIGEDLTHFGSHACHPVFFPQWNLACLMSDDGTAMLTPCVTPGQPGTVANSQCVLNGPGMSKSVNGRQFTASFPVTFQPTWPGPEYIDAYAQTFANYNSGWLREGLWTIPTMSYRPLSIGTFELDTTYPSTTIDDYTGLAVPVPTSANPLATLNLSSASQDSPDVLHYGDAFTMTVRHAKPNTQVWVYEMDATLEAGCDPRNTPPCGYYDGGGQAGVTDNTGYALISSTVSTTPGDHNYLIYVANRSGNPLTVLQESDLVGGLSFFATSTSNNPAPPSYYTARRPNGRTIQAARAKPIRLHAPTSTYQKVGGNWEYDFDLDTTTANIFRIGHDDGYQGDPDDTNNINFQHQNGWYGGGNGWIYAEGISTRSEHSKFKLVSDWLPGPVSVMFAETVPEAFEMQESDAEQQAQASYGGIFKASTRRNVIGPAIAPDDSPRNLLARIRNWVDQGNHFLIPLTKDGADLPAELAKLTPAEGYEQNVVDCIKAALETFNSRK